MSKVTIVTDSAATVPKDLAQELNIHVVPVLLNFGSQSLRDGVDVTPTEVYRQLRANKRIPTSSAPSVGDFVRVYASVAQQASGILSIHVAARLSTTHNVALVASQLVNGVPIHVYDSNTAAMAQGFIVLEAARAAARGATLDGVLDRADEVTSRVQFYFILDTFEYLKRGGRIGAAAALMGTMLQIKPVLHLRDGQVDVLVRPRTRRKALEVLLQLMEAKVGTRPVHMAVSHADAPQEAEELRQTVAERFNCIELFTTEFTPVMGAHTGPGLLGVGFFAD
jgi:DegV family protein with EDD domain